MIGKITGDNSPFHCRFWMDTRGEEEKKHYQEGHALHMALLEPQEYRKALFILPTIDKRSSTKREERAKLIASNPGRLHLEQEQADKIERYLEAIRRHKDLAGALSTAGGSEVCYVWKDEVTGLPCKGRVDREVGANIVLDFKTTGRGTSPRVASTQLWEHSYYRQAWMYLYGRKQLGLPAEQFILGSAHGLSPETLASPAGEDRRVEPAVEPHATEAGQTVPGDGDGRDPDALRLPL